MSHEPKIVLMVRTQREAQLLIRCFPGDSTVLERGGSLTPISSPDMIDAPLILIYNTFSLNRMVPEASPEVRAAAIRLAISTLVPVIGGSILVHHI